MDDRVKKGAVLKEWIEKAASDSVRPIAMTNREPWSATLDRILAEKSRPDELRRFDSRFDSPGKVKSVDPDGQFSNENSSSSALLLPLDNVDRLDQESLLKYIWQLIRCGCLVEAQQVAATHGVYWLTGSLIGVAYHRRPETQSINDDGEAVLARVGNQRQPIWLRTCWRYADQLSKVPENWNSRAASESIVFDVASPPFKKNRNDDSLVGILEMSIYAALSNHTKVLLRSPVISTWHDRLWVLLKAVHERDVCKIVHRYRCLKLQHSNLFPGCTDSIIAAEKDILECARDDIGHMSTGDCKYILSRANPPTQNDAESIILRLQAAIIVGKSGIAAFIENTIKKYLSTTSNRNSIPGHAAILRVFCHFCIWLRTIDEEGSSGGGASSESKRDSFDLVSDDIFYLAVEAYVDHLIQSNQPHLVASYVTYLSRGRRISKYAQLLRSLQSQQQMKSSRFGTNSKSDEDESQVPVVLRLASTLFEEDVIDITRAVAERPVNRGGGATAVDFSVAIKSPQPNSSVVPRNQSFSASAIKSVRFQLSDSSEHSAPDDRMILSTVTPIVDRKSSEAVATPQSGWNSFRSSRGRQATPRNFKRSNLSSTLFKANANPKLEELPEPEENGTITISQPSVPEELRSVRTPLQQQMDSLRWLYYDPIHRFEAVRQTNRLALQLLSRDDLTVLPLLKSLIVSGEYLPLNSVEIGYSQLQQRKDELDELISPTLYQHLEGQQPLTPINDRFGGLLFSQGKRNGNGNGMDDQIRIFRESLELDEQVWEALVSQLELWQNYVGAIDDVTAFSQVSEWNDIIEGETFQIVILGSC